MQAPTSMSKPFTAPFSLPRLPHKDAVLSADPLSSPTWTMIHPFLLSTIEHPLYLTIHPNRPGGPPSSYLLHKYSGQNSHGDFIAFAYRSCIPDSRDSGGVELKSGVLFFSSFSCDWPTQQMYILNSPCRPDLVTPVKEQGLVSTFKYLTA